MKLPPVKDIEHLLKLAVIFGVGALIFAAGRAALVPKDFGELGHYRTGAIADARVRPAVYAGQATCKECHEDVFDTRAPSRHAALSCEACHGPLAKHVTSGGEQEPPKVAADALCLKCHAANTGKPAKYPTIDVKEHSDDPCVSCHKPHDPRIE